MADKTEFLQAIDDAILDADSLERFVNGGEAETVLTRLNAEYPTIQKMIAKIDDDFKKLSTDATTDYQALFEQLMEENNLAGRFKTVEQLQVEGVALSDGAYALVADDVDDRNGIYIKEGGAWIKSQYNPSSYAIEKAAEHLNQYVDSNGGNYLDIAIDDNGDAYRYTALDGGVHVVGLKESVQESLNKLIAEMEVQSAIKNALVLNDSQHLSVVADESENASAYIDSNSNLSVAGDVSAYKHGQSITKSIFNVNKYNANLTSHLLGSTALNKSTAIHLASEDSELRHKRMPFGIKTTYGLLVVYHSQTDKQYNGDSAGSELWKAVIDIDGQYNTTVRSKERFITHEQAEGVIKHPMLGRTSDGRIILVFEKGNLNQYVVYKRYICFSKDEGLTFSEPVPLNDGIHEIGSTATALGSAGDIVSSHNNSLVIPMYGDIGLFSLISYNDGATWFRGKYCKFDTERKFHEPAVVVDFNGNLLMDLRSNNRYRARAMSYDNGYTWELLGSDYEELEVSDVQGSMLMDRNFGALVHACPSNNWRRDITISLSFDNGRTFSFKKKVVEGGYVAYSHVVQLGKGVYALLYESAASQQLGGNKQEGVSLNIFNLKEVM